MHHIISDGWSLGVFFWELAALYESCCTTREQRYLNCPFSMQTMLFGSGSGGRERYGRPNQLTGNNN